MRTTPFHSFQEKKINACSLYATLFQESTVRTERANLSRRRHVFRFCITQFYKSPQYNYGGDEVRQNGMFHAVNAGWLNLYVHLKTDLVGHLWWQADEQRDGNKQTNNAMETLL